MAVGLPFSLMSAPIVIDGKGHVEGRLAAAVAKQLLEGKTIVVVRAEDILTNGDHKFNYHKYRRYLDKTTNTNPGDGPFHQRGPSQMFLKAVRGMCNYKTGRGANAFGRLKVFEGVPPKYAHTHKLVVPQALKVVSVGRDRPVTSLGRIATTFGWKYGSVVNNLEGKRLSESGQAFQARQEGSGKKQRAIFSANQQLGAAAVKFLETYIE
jgi:large subunit ribosomal protein L13Ae